jgi:hypothetical protein
MFDQREGMGSIPSDLDERQPGLFLTAHLSKIESKDLSGYERVLVLRAYQRMVSYFQAQVYEEMASIWDEMGQIDADPNVAAESTAAEIRAALRLTRRAADSELAFALDLRQRLPRVWEALAAGEIDLRRARVIVRGIGHLSDETAREVVDRIIERARRLTTGELVAQLRRVCIQADPDHAARRYEDAVSERRIIAEPTTDVTTNLFGIDLPPDRAAAAMHRINNLAQSLKGTDETRSLDQIRADVFLDLLDGHATKASLGWARNG